MLRRLVDARGRIVAALALACGAFVVAHTIGLVVETWADAPFQDQWGNLISGRVVTLDWLFSQHNEHRIAVPRLIFMLDRWLASERNIVDLAVNLAVQAMVAATFAIVATQGARRPWRVGILGFTFAMVFWPAQWENLIWGFQVGFLGVALGAMATFWIVLNTAPSFLSLVGIMLAMGITTYTIASGVIAALIAPGLALLARRPRAHVAVLALWAAGLGILYAYGLRTHRSEMPPVGPLDLGTYLLAEVGGPFGGFFTAFGAAPVSASEISGCAILVLAAALTGMLLRHLRSNAVLFLLATAAFALGSMLLTTYGRAGFGVEQSLASRYATPCIAFWTSTALLGIVLARQRGAAYVPLACALPTVMILLALVTQDRYDKIAERFASVNEAAVPAMLSRVDDPTFVRPVMAYPEQGYRALETLRAAKTSIFARPEADYLGQTISALGLAIIGQDCGDVAGAGLVGVPPNDGWRIEGSVQPKTRQIIITDQEGTVIGYGGPTALTHHWVGYVPKDGVAGVRPFAVMRSGELCALMPSHVTAGHPLTLASVPSGLSPNGSLDNVKTSPTIALAGWGMVASSSPTSAFHLDTNIPAATAVIYRLPRPDVAAALHEPRLADSGFNVIVRTDGSPMPTDIRLCLWTDDPVFGRRVVPIPTRPDLCRAA